MAPEIRCNQGITGGTTSITGDFTEREAKDLALLIRAGALPVPVEIVEQRTIGPTLGDAAVEASVQAALIGALLTTLYMIAYYRLLGVLAAVALAAYGALSYAVLLLIGATLTLPGIAGFVLAIGMAVDANVLVYERIKEEAAGGTSTRRAAHRGFEKAWTAIADSNATTLLAAVLLFFFASGAVRGFGITLSIGVLVSVFTALVVTRLLVDAVLRTRLRDHPKLLGLEVGGQFRAWIARRRPNLLRHFRRWLGGVRASPSSSPSPASPPRGWTTASSSPAAGCWSTTRPGPPTSTTCAGRWPAPAFPAPSSRSPATATSPSVRPSSAPARSNGCGARSSRWRASRPSCATSSSARPSARSCAARR